MVLKEESSEGSQKSVPVGDQFDFTDFELPWHEYGPLQEQNALAVDGDESSVRSHSVAPAKRRKEMPTPSVEPKADEATVKEETETIVQSEIPTKTAPRKFLKTIPPRRVSRHQTASSEAPSEAPPAEDTDETSSRATPAPAPTTKRPPNRRTGSRTSSRKKK